MLKFNVVALLIVISCTPLTLTSQEKIDFNRQIRPLLSDRCYLCHGPDDGTRAAGMRLDREDDAIDAGVWVEGEPDESTLVERIESENPRMVMPPPDSNLSLSKDEKLLLRKWIEQGAKYDTHWAFKKLPGSVAVPNVEVSQENQNENPELAVWPRNEIDSFVLRRLLNEQLSPSPETSRWQWLRRVTFDLTGLPPTAEEIDEFVSDESADAYEKVVDRLLASKHFGKHMATSWLDAVRYADSFGYQSDQLSTTWPYRDWVVRALNDNLPYDQFLTWQVAGDMLPNATREQRLATAFNRLHRQTNEGGSVQLEWQTEYVADRIQTLSTSVMGLTLECARCHDHKYDPLPQQDFYNMFAFFNNVDEWGTYHDSSRVPTPSLLLPTDAQEEQIRGLERQIADVNRKLDKEKKALLIAELDQWQKEYLPFNTLPKPVHHWTLDEYTTEQRFADMGTAEAKQNGSSNPANQIVDGRIGHALRLTGDDAANFSAPGGLHPWQRYAVSMWLKIPKDLKDGVILHRQGGTDVGRFGTELSLRNGRLLFAKIRFWPGNALAVETAEPVDVEKWLHVVISNDASGEAGGLKLLVNGTANNRVVQNSLTKDPAPREGGFVIGQRFRSAGYQGGEIDDIQFFDRPLSILEARLLGQRPVASEAGIDQPAVGVQDASQAAIEEHFLSTQDSYTSLLQERAQLFQKLLAARMPVTEAMVMKEAEDIRPAYVLYRGDYDAPRTEKNLARRATLSALPPMSDTLPKNRLGLAKWLTSNDHPLTARVAVNRYWQLMFGTGIVTTPEDFGVQGSVPTHPDLLDWLSRDFVDHGWDVKRLCKQIVLSSTYRQSSRCSSVLRKNDPDNLLLARGPSRRLSAEMIRDMSLFASGLLIGKEGGPPVSPYQPENLWRENNSMTPAYRQSVGQGLYHRSLYSVWKRTTPLPNMLSFDATSREVCTVRRSTTNTPLQALVLLNDVQFVEASRVLAEMALEVEPNEVERRVEFIFVRLAGRKSDQQELKLLKQLYDEQIEIFAGSPDDAKQLVAVGSQKVRSEASPIHLAATTVVTQTILSLDATIWKR